MEDDGLQKEKRVQKVKNRFGCIIKEESIIFYGFMVIILNCF